MRDKIRKEHKSQKRDFERRTKRMAVSTEIETDLFGSVLRNVEAGVERVYKQADSLEYVNAARDVKQMLDILWGSELHRSDIGNERIKEIIENIKIVKIFLPVFGDNKTYIIQDYRLDDMSAYAVRHMTINSTLRLVITVPTIDKIKADDRLNSVLHRVGMMALHRDILHKYYKKKFMFEDIVIDIVCFLYNAGKSLSLNLPDYNKDVKGISEFVVRYYQKFWKGNSELEKLEYEDLLSLINTFADYDCDNMTIYAQQLYEMYVTGKNR
jgi:hypothetical protein